MRLATTAGQGQQYAAGIYGVNEGTYNDRNFSFSTFYATPAYISGETYEYNTVAGGSTNHLFPPLTNDYLNTHLLSGYMATSVGMYVDATNSGGTALPANAGRTASIRVGIYEPISRGSDMSLAVIGLTKNPMTAEQRKALATLCSLEWGSPMPV